MRKRRLLAVFLSLALAVTMCFAGAGPVFAGEDCGLAVVSDTDQAAVDVMEVGDTEEIMELEAAEQQIADAESLKGASIASDDIPEVPLNQGVYMYGSTKKFQVKVPSSGYITLTMAGISGVDGDNYIYSVKAKTKGFSDYVYFNNVQNIRWIGVKKGIYTFDVDTSANYIYVKAKFTKVKDRYGKTKAKARTVKKKKAQKALMITGAQKTHWYKIKNTKTHKVIITFKNKLTYTGNSMGGGITVTFYKGSKSYGSVNIPDSVAKKPLNPYNYYGYKLLKGTYYVKVQPYKKGTGFFSMKWK